MYVAQSRMPTTKDYYYEPDPNDLGTYIKKQKQPGYMNSGTFIYDSDPEIPKEEQPSLSWTMGLIRQAMSNSNPCGVTQMTSPVILFLESLKTSLGCPRPVWEQVPLLIWRR